MNVSAPTDLCPGDSGYAVHAESGELLLGEGGDQVGVLGRVQERVQGSLVSAAKKPTFLAFSVCGSMTYWRGSGSMDLYL
jgi:hypothetical protein